MRKIADIPVPSDRYVRAMIYDSPDGVYLFLFSIVEDGPADADYWFENVSDAEHAALERFGIALDAWTPIKDPRAGCQHDWIADVRVKRDGNDEPIWGQFELLADQ